MTNKRLRNLLVVVLIVGVLSSLLVTVPALAATSADVTITATPEYLAMTLSDGGTNTWAIGYVAESTTKWYTADGNAPSPEPFEDSDMKIVLTNTGSVSENFSIHAHNFTGGVGWVISEDDTPAADEVSIRAGVTGTTNAAAMVQVIHEDAELKHEVTASGHIDSCLSLKTGTFTDGAAKSTTLTYTVTKHT